MNELINRLINKAKNKSELKILNSFKQKKKIIKTPKKTIKMKLTE